MKTIIKQLFSEAELHIEDSFMDNDEFVTLSIQDMEEEEFASIDVSIEELLRAVKSYEKENI